jgi:hypothetical protein
MGAAEVRPGEVGCLKVGLTEARLAEAHLAQVRLAQIRPNQVRLVEVRSQLAVRRPPGIPAGGPLFQQAETAVTRPESGQFHLL